ncbi:MAG: MerR family transcriptional regulator [Streptosporangiaceae bacterium]
MEHGPGLSVGTVASRLGVAAATLRTWDRRYGIGPSRRSTGSHRRYDPADVARLEVMHRMILQGAPPGEAARTALSAPAGDRRSAQGHGAGGHRLRLPAGTPRSRGLARAAMALDEPAVTATLQESLRRDGVVRTWDDLIVPVLASLGDKHAATGGYIDVEHLLSYATMACLAGVARRAEPLNERPVLLACAPEEQHGLPVQALAAALTELGIDSRQLGARVPAVALAEAARRLGPAAVFVWSQTAQTADPAALAALPAMRPAVRLLVGGPGWAFHRLPDDIRPLTTLPDALCEVSAALGLFF